MNELILNRPKEQSNKLQSYSVFVDDEQVAELKNDSQQSISVDANKITLKAKLHWCGSNSKQFTFDGKDKLTVNIQGNQFYYKMLLVCFPFLLTFIVLPNIFSDSQSIKYISISFIVLMCIYLIYSVTVNKNSWITISES